MKNNEKMLITAALPYANGPIHIGHLLEYIQADVFVRALKLMGKDAIYICADDTHGTPIQINAMKQNISPEKLIEKYHIEHEKDFKAFNIKFDNFYTTNSEENKELVEHIFNEALKKGLIYKKKMKQLYCEHDKMFLPDRFVKGTCPVCGAENQYGDVCEVCGAVYKPTDLINPYCVLCGNKPIVKETENYFFKLSSLSEDLRKWLKDNRELQREVVNSIMNWLDKGLDDWCISRDKPYFGFKIPGTEDKYFYVWMDAPVGYIASTWNYCKKHGLNYEDYWKKPGSKIIHIIGKDIIYFHLLFWPALLMTSGFNLPYKEVVHGFVNINGEKMSKSRHTFITARDFLNSKINPEFLRFYYASNLSKKLSDINIDFRDFKKRINNELIANIANFSYRTLSFINTHFDSEISDFNEQDYKNMISELNRHIEKAIKNYEDFEFRKAVKEILIVSDIGNKFFQENEPWKLIKTENQKAWQVVSLSANIVKNIAILLSPILPAFSDEMLKQLNLASEKVSFSNLNFDLKKHKINTANIVIKKLEDDDFKGLMPDVKGESVSGEREHNEQKEDKFSRVDLRVAVVKNVKDHPDADKLYILKIDFGNEERQLVAGLKSYYKPEELLGKHLVVVYNLKPAKLRGYESQGMLLAGDDGKNVIVLEAPNSEAGSSVFVDGIEKKPKKKITVSEFFETKLTTKNKKAVYNGKPLRTDKEEISVDIVDNARIR